VPWCKEQSPPIAPVSFTKFGTILKMPVAQGGCGVELVRTPSKRDFYVGFALATSPRLAVSNA
jgi:hypothetical protein